ncbi:MAG TPA: hypothetical protein VK597_05810 [Inquilinus sp.]|nr:hypothetical protein [Inquilinus sp.]
MKVSESRDMSAAESPKDPSSPARARSVDATSEGKEGFFTAGYRRVVLKGVGHFPQRKAAHRVAAEISGFLRTI